MNPRQPGNRPEYSNDPAWLRTCIWYEVALTGERPPYGNRPRAYAEQDSVEQWDHDNQAELALAQGFKRARTVFEGLWFLPRTYSLGLDIQVDPNAVSQEESGSVMRLLQLVMLSRARVTSDATNPNWAAPSWQELGRIREEMREELGCTEAYASQERSIFSPDFPGVSADQLADAILDGRLTMGNAEQPFPVCYNRWGFDADGNPNK